MSSEKVVIAVIAVVVVVYWCLYTFVLAPRRIRRECEDRKEREQKCEEARIARLPQLDVTWLLPVPADRMGANPVKATYGSRYNRLLIIDREGCGWVGLAVPEVINSLREAEYVQCNHWIPFRGDGEMRSGPTVEVDGVRIDFYPDWFWASQTDTLEWLKWSKIQRHFNAVSKDLSFDYQDGLLGLYDAAKQRKTARR